MWPFLLERFPNPGLNLSFWFITNIFYFRYRKMVKYCSAVDCKNNSKSGNVKLYRFPMNKQRSLLWAKRSWIDKEPKNMICGRLPSIPYCAVPTLSEVHINFPIILKYINFQFDKFIVCVNTALVAKGLISSPILYWCGDHRW